MHIYGYTEDYLTVYSNEGSGPGTDVGSMTSNTKQLQPDGLIPKYISMPLVSLEHETRTNGSDPYLRNWTLIFSQGPSRDEQLAALQHFVALMEVYYTPTLASFGLTTNLYLVGLAFGGRLKTLPMAPFILTLALSDTFYLTALLISWLDNTQATKIQSVPGLCQCVNFLFFLGNCLSIWFLMCIQIERYISMWHISRRPQPQNLRRSTFIACSVGLLGLLMYSCVLWTSGHLPGGNKRCSFLPKYYDVLRIFTKADTLVAVLLPYSMMPVLNLLVFIQVLIKAATVRRHGPPVDGTPSAPDQDSLGYVSRIRRQVRCTASFLAISSIVWILAMPAQAMRMTDFFSFEPQKPMSQRDQIYLQICNFPHSLSFAIKFMLYLSFSALFRDAVLDCCRLCECASGCKTGMEGTTSGDHNHMSPIPSSINSLPSTPPLSPQHNETVSKL